MYKKLGGVKWLLEFAKANPAEFIRQGLSRLLPAPQKADGDDTGGGNQFNQNNYYNLSPLEAAKRVAFALNAGIHAQDAREPELIEVTGRTPAPEPVEQPEISPQEACRWGAPGQPNPSPHQEALDADRQRWAQEVHLTDDQRRDNQLIRQTTECSLETYAGGSSAEQFDAPRRPSSRRPSPGELCRALSRRGRDLL
ncbi:hypothetical protein [Pseudomonas sp. BEA3.1]|uniref:hypothetical protein n=1 Tax=Pseudomonas sp. BEA3.1 TaxID=3083251 RepID=UPI0029656402|nr:hypothetical protein [Pseudomonas sp. BEA3.1]MDW2777442.1 hypothetical protein [Pseudomonas sp. BEA3.1]